MRRQRWPLPVVSAASRTSPGCRMKVSPSRVVNSRVPDNVMTYWHVRGGVPFQGRPGRGLLELHRGRLFQDPQRDHQFFDVRLTVFTRK